MFYECLVGKRKSPRTKNLSEILMVSFTVLSILIMVVLLFTFLGRSNPVVYLIVLSGIVVMNIVMYQWDRHVSEKNQWWEQRRFLQEINEERMLLYKEISVEYDEQKQLLHDYKNQIGYIQSLIKSEKYQVAERYADKLFELFPNKLESIDVNNPVLNVVLNQKYRQAQIKDISMVFHVNNLSDLWLNDRDIVSLLSNLLDNAIEACEKLEENRVIQIKILREKRELLLSVRNPVSVPVRISNKGINTKKKDKKRHGFGLKNVQMVLEKYGGMGMMRYEEGYFYYTAVIPDLF